MTLSVTSTRINDHCYRQASYFHRNFTITWNIWIIYYAKCLFTTITPLIFVFYSPYMMVSTTPSSIACFTHSSSSSTSALFCFLFVLHTASICPIPLHFLHCFPLAGHHGSLALCPTFPQQKHVKFLVLKALRDPSSTHTINLVTRITWCYGRTGLFLRFFHSTGNFSQSLQRQGVTLLK